MISSIRTPHILLENWKFQLGDVSGAQERELDDSSWRILDLPHDWSIENSPEAEAPARGDGGYFPTGIGWYRHEIEAPEAWRGQKIALELEGVGGIAQVWLNGELVGEHPYGFAPYHCDLTPQLKIGEANVLAVRVDNSQQPNCRWYSGSGLFRPVALHVTPALHLETHGLFVTTREASPEQALLDLQVEVGNDGPAQNFKVEVTLFDPENEAVGTLQLQGSAPSGETWTGSGEIEIARPKLWSPETPVLYSARIQIQGGNTTDVTEHRFGIRMIVWSAQRGLELNGQSLKLCGGNLHHDNGPLGAVTFPTAELRRVQKLKEAGFNAIRTAHNPPSTAFFDACDKLGMLVVDEAFDGWAARKLRHDYADHFHEWWPRDIEAFVLRDHNHPSVVMWSIGNEVFERGKESGIELSGALSAQIRRFDTSRPVTVGLNGLGAERPWSDLDPVFAPVDIAGLNYELHRAPVDHERVPERVMVGSESYQNDAFEVWDLVERHPYIIGDFVWSASDYLGEAGLGRVFEPREEALLPWQGSQFPFHGALCGDLDLLLHRKPISHYRNILWNRGETLFVAVHTPCPASGPRQLLQWAVPPKQSHWTWPDYEGQLLPVEIYSRHESVCLFLNDQLLGERPTGRPQQFKATFLVPYTAGVLRAVGAQDGREIEEFVLQTAGVPASIQITPEKSNLLADGQDLAFLPIEIRDQNGLLCPHADSLLHVQISGPAQILALGSGDLTNCQSYQSSSRQAFEGRALLVLRAGRETGKVEVVVEAEGLKSARIELWCEDTNP